MSGKAPVSRAACWGCGAQVPLRYGGGVCPSCGARLRTIDYDAAAVDIVSARVEKERRLNALVQAHLEAEEKNARWGVLRGLPILPSRRRLKAIEGERVAVLAEVQGLANHARELASARYYMGEWYRTTGMHLRCDAPGRDGFDRNPLEAAYYDNEGVFHVKTRLKTKILRGIFGEYVVFERLAAALERGDLPFGRVLRALYIPDFGSCERDPYGANFTEEVDMLLVASRALYVIEVKNLRGSITVRRQKFLDRYEVEVTPPAGSSSTSHSGAYFDRGPSQNHRHVCALRHAIQGLVPQEAIVNLVVYVGNGGGFIMDAPQGIGGAYIATTDVGEQGVLDVIRAIESSMPFRWSEAELSDLAAFLDAEYSDVDGSKAEAHRRAREMHARAPRPSGSSGRSYRASAKHGKGRGFGRGSSRCARDDELERMIRALR